MGKAKREWKKKMRAARNGTEAERRAVLEEGIEIAKKAPPIETFPQEARDGLFGLKRLPQRQGRAEKKRRRRQLRNLVT